jgi:B9 domain-containing protein 1
LLSLIRGKNPEYLDPLFISKSFGREVTKVQSSGTVKCLLNVVLKGIKEFGYAL